MTIFLTLRVVVAALVCFVAEWLPVDITALCVAAILIVLGVDVLEIIRDGEKPPQSQSRSNDVCRNFCCF